MPDPEQDFDERLRRARQAFDPSADDTPKMPGKSDDDARGLLMAAMEFSVTMIAGAMIGWFIDRHFATTPYGVIIMAIIGMVAGIYNLYRSVQGYGEQLGYKGQDSNQEKDNN